MPGIVGDPDKTRKPVGEDLRRGKKTAIVIHARSLKDTALDAQLDSVMNNPAATDEQLRSAVASLEGAGCIEFARNLSREYRDRAKANLNSLPETEYRDLLEGMALYQVERSG